MPFLKLNNELMFGGLGKVVDVRWGNVLVNSHTSHHDNACNTPLHPQIFLRYSSNPVTLIAPVYKPLLNEEDKPSSLGAPVLSFSAEVFTARIPVDVYLIADPAGTSFTFLVDAEIFRNRTRGLIYTWQR